MPDPAYAICDAGALEATLGAPLDFVRAKIATRLNDAMAEFVRRSPFALVSTIDAEGRIDISPKGDPAGFVQIDGQGDLLVPERLGNRLTFGFHNILSNQQIGLIFMIPNQRETLRVKGLATLHRDPDILDTMAVGGKPALLYTRVQVQECFFHCGKALVRSHLWDPKHWDSEKRPIAARQFTPRPTPDEETVRRTEAALEHSYTHDLY